MCAVLVLTVLILCKHVRPFVFSRLLPEQRGFAPGIRDFCAFLCHGNLRSLNGCSIACSVQSYAAPCNLVGKCLHTIS